MVGGQPVNILLNFKQIFIYYQADFRFSRWTFLGKHRKSLNAHAE
jgi:hypothetical protein